MTRCAICRASCRKTTTVYVMNEGALVRHRVCSGCVKQTVRVHVGGAPSRCSCGKLATVCAPCSTKFGANVDRAKLIRAAATKLYGLVRAYGLDLTDDYARGRVDGLQQAADVVAAGKF
jgi:hypothetical protein